MRQLLDFLILSQCEDKTSNTIIGKAVIRLFEKVQKTLDIIGKSDAEGSITQLLKTVVSYDADLAS